MHDGMVKRYRLENCTIWLFLYSFWWWDSFTGIVFFGLFRRVVTSVNGFLSQHVCCLCTNFLLLPFTVPWQTHQMMQFLDDTRPARDPLKPCVKHLPGLIHQLPRFPHCRYLFTGKDEVRWSSHKENPEKTCHKTSSHKVDKDSLYNEVTVEYYRGLPQVTVPLPSRRKRCRFTLRPVSNTVGDFMAMISNEDHGIDHVSVSTPDGIRIASSNTIEALMEDDFRLVINDVCYHVKTPKQEKLTREEVERLSDVKNLVHQLYEALNVEEHQLKKERDLCGQLEELKMELEPLEQKLQKLHTTADKQTNVLAWVGLGLMSVQFGILARLTWWEYSWDIMEPVTYFVTYGTAMAAYAYYVLTKQEYILPEVRDRQYLITLHKKAKKVGLDLDKYNEIKDRIYVVERDLRRLRDPLQVHLPPHHLADSLKKSQSPFAKALGIFQKKSSKTVSSSAAAAVVEESNKDKKSSS